MPGRLAGTKSSSGQARSHWRGVGGFPIALSIPLPQVQAEMTAAYILQCDIGTSLGEWRVTERHSGR